MKRLNGAGSITRDSLCVSITLDRYSRLIYMPHRDIGPRSRQFIKNLRAFCQAEEGRAARLAEYLGCSTVTVYNWWSLKRFPSTEQMLGAQEWLSLHSGQK
jgi:hypothetical protein